MDMRNILMWPELPNGYVQKLPVSQSEYVSNAIKWALMRIHYIPEHQIPLVKRRGISSSSRLRVFVRGAMYRFLLAPCHSESHVAASLTLRHSWVSKCVLLQLIAGVGTKSADAFAKGRIITNYPQPTATKATKYNSWALASLPLALYGARTLRGPTILCSCAIFLIRRNESRWDGPSVGLDSQVAVSRKRSFVGDGRRAPRSSRCQVLEPCSRF